MQDIRELAFILLIIVLVITGVQWFLLRFTHWSVALAATGVISFIVAFIYVSLKNARPNGGSSGPKFSEYLMPTFIVFTLLLCGFSLLCYLTQNQIPKMAVILSLGLAAAIAIGSYGYQKVKNITSYYDLFSSVEIKVLNEAGDTSNLQEIGFKNTSNGIYILLEPNSEDASVSRMIRFADKIFFRGNSAESNRMVRQEFPFDYSLCKEEKINGSGLFFWVKPVGILPMKFVVQAGGKVDLYLGGNFVKQYLIDYSE